MIRIEEISVEQLYLYNNIEFCYTTNKKYEITKINRGLGGFLLNVIDIEPFTKKFKENVEDWKKDFDLSNWKFFIAYDNNIPVGGATLAIVLDKSGTKNYAKLWDLRVTENYKHQGVGQLLFDKVKDVTKLLGINEIKIECQNTNYAAVNFYHKQGAILRCINDHAYIDFPNEAQMFWYLEI